MPKKREAAPQQKPPPFTASVPVVSVGEEQAPVETRNLTLELAATGSPASATVLLDCRDPESGAWRPEVQFPPLRLVDAPEGETPEQHAQDPETVSDPATMLANFILSARVDPHDPLADYFGIKNNEPLSNALPLAVHGLLSDQGTLKRKETS